MNISVTLSPKEKNNLNKFHIKHNKCKSNLAIGVRFTYLITPSGLGTFVSVRCNICNDIKNINDFEDW